MSLPPVVFEERETASGHRVGHATLHRQRQLNALNLEMCELLLQRLRRWQISRDRKSTRLNSSHT